MLQLNFQQSWFGEAHHDNLYIWLFTAEYIPYPSFMKLHHNYYVYILLCSDGSYYTGMTNDIERRLEEHNQGLISSCYTFLRRPIELKYYEYYQYVKDAICREKQIKRWSRKKKEALINEDFQELKRLAKNRISQDEGHSGNCD